MDWSKLLALQVILLVFIYTTAVYGRPTKDKDSRKIKEKRQSTRGGVKSFDDVLPFVEEATGTVFTAAQKQDAQSIIGKITNDIVEGKVKEDLEHHIQDLEKMLTAVTGFEIDLGMNVKNLIAPTITFENLKSASALLHKVREGKMDIKEAMSEIKAFLEKGFDVDLMDEATKKEMTRLLESMDEMASSGNIDEYAWKALHIRIIFFLKKYDQKVKDIETREIDQTSKDYKSMADYSRKLYKLIYKWKKSDSKDPKKMKLLKSTVKKIEDSGMMENDTAKELRKRMKKIEKESKNGNHDKDLLKALGNIALYNLFSNNEPLKPKVVKKNTGVKEKVPDASGEHEPKELGSSENIAATRKGTAQENIDDPMSNSSEDMDEETIKNPAVNIDADVVESQVSGTINSFDDIIPFVESTKGIKFSDKDNKAVQDFIARIKIGILQGVPMKKMSKFVENLELKLKELTDYEIDILKIADDLYEPTETFELLKQLRLLIKRLAKGGGSESGKIVLKIGKVIKKLKMSNMLEQEEKEEMDLLFKDIKKNGKLGKKKSKDYSTTISAVLKRYNQSMNQNPSDSTFAILNELRDLLRGIIQNVKDGNIKELKGDLAEMKTLILTLKKIGGLKVKETKELVKTMNALKKAKKKNGEVDLSAFELMAEYIDQLAKQNNIPYDASSDGNLGIGDLAPMLLTLMNNHGTDDADPHNLLPQIHKLILKLIKDKNINDDIKKELNDHFKLLNGKYKKSEKIDLHELEILATLVEKLSQLLSQKTGLMAALKGAQELLQPSQMFDVEIVTQIKLLRRTDFDYMEELINTVQFILDAVENGETLDKSSVKKFIDAVSKTLKSRTKQDGLYASGSFASLDELIPHIEAVAGNKLQKGVKKEINKMIGDLKACVEMGANFEMKEDCMKIVSMIEKKLENATGTLIDLHSHIKEFLQFTYLNDSLVHLIPILKTALSEGDIIKSIHGSHSHSSAYVEDDVDDGDDDSDDSEKSSDHNEDHDHNDDQDHNDDENSDEGDDSDDDDNDDSIDKDEEDDKFPSKIASKRESDNIDSVMVYNNPVNHYITDDEKAEYYDQLHEEIKSQGPSKIDSGAMTVTLTLDDLVPYVEGTIGVIFNDTDRAALSLMVDDLKTEVEKNTNEEEIAALADRIEAKLMNITGYKIDIGSITENLIEQKDENDTIDDESQHFTYSNSIYDLEDTTPLNEDEDIARIKTHRVKRFLDSKQLNILADKIEQSVYDYPAGLSDTVLHEDNISYNSENGDPKLQTFSHNYHEKISPFGYEDMTEFLDSEELKLLADELEDSSSITRRQKNVHYYKDPNKPGNLKSVKSQNNNLDVKIYKNYDELLLTKGEDINSFYSDQLLGHEDYNDVYDDFIFDDGNYSQIGKLTSDEKLLSDEIDATINWQGTTESYNPLDSSAYNQMHNKNLLNIKRAKVSKEQMELTADKNRHFRQLDSGPAVNKFTFISDNKEHLIDHSIEQNSVPTKHGLIQQSISYNNEENVKNEMNRLEQDENTSDKIEKKEDPGDVVDDDEIHESMDDKNNESLKTNEIVKEDDETQSKDRSLENESTIDAKDEKNLDESIEEDGSTSDSKTQKVDDNSMEENLMKYSSEEVNIFDNSNEDELKDTSTEDENDEKISTESELDDHNESEEKGDTLSNLNEEALNETSESDSKDDVKINSNEDEVDQSKETESEEENIIELNEMNKGLSMKFDILEVINSKEDEFSNGDKNSFSDDEEDQQESIEISDDLSFTDSTSMESKLNGDVENKNIISKDVGSEAQSHEKDEDLSNSDIDITKEQMDDLLNNTRINISENMTILGTEKNTEKVPDKTKIAVDITSPLDNNIPPKPLATSPKTLLAPKITSKGKTGLENKYISFTENGDKIKSTTIPFITSNVSKDSTNIEIVSKPFEYNQQLTISGHDKAVLSDSGNLSKGVNSNDNETMTSQEIVSPNQSPSILDLLSGSNDFGTNRRTEAVSDQSMQSNLEENYFMINSDISNENQSFDVNITPTQNNPSEVDDKTDFDSNSPKVETNNNDNKRTRAGKNLDKPKNNNDDDLHIKQGNNRFKRKLSNREKSSEEESSSNEKDNKKKGNGSHSDTHNTNLEKEFIEDDSSKEGMSTEEESSSNESDDKNKEYGQNGDAHDNNHEKGLTKYDSSKEEVSIEDELRNDKRNNNKHDQAPPLGNDDPESTESDQPHDKDNRSREDEGSVEDSSSKEQDDNKQEKSISDEYSNHDEKFSNEESSSKEDQSENSKFDDEEESSIEGSSSIEKDTKEKSESDQLHHKRHNKSSLKVKLDDDVESSEEKELMKDTYNVNQERESSEDEDMVLDKHRTMSNSTMNKNHTTVFNVTYSDLQSLMKTFESLALEQNLINEAMEEVYQIKMMVPNIIENVFNETERASLITDIYLRIRESVNLLKARRPPGSGLKDFKTYITFVKALSLHGMDKPLDAQSMLKNLSIVTLNDKLKRCLPGPLAKDIALLQKVVQLAISMDTDFPDDQDTVKLKTEFKDMFDIATKTKNLIHDDSYDNCEN